MAQSHQEYPMGYKTTFKFGKYKGMTLYTILEDDFNYIMWCMDNVDGFELADEPFDEYTEKRIEYDTGDMFDSFGNN